MDDRCFTINKPSEFYRINQLSVKTSVQRQLEHSRSCLSDIDVDDNECHATAGIFYAMIVDDSLVDVGITLIMKMPSLFESSTWSLSSGTLECHEVTWRCIRPQIGPSAVFRS